MHVKSSSFLGTVKTRVLVDGIDVHARAFVSRTPALVLRYRGSKFYIFGGDHKAASLLQSRCWLREGEQPLPQEPADGRKGSRG